VRHLPPPEAKILPLRELLDRLTPRRAAGQRVVLTNGCFDLLHSGHVRYLAAAAELADILIVGLNSDASVRQLKKPGRPLVPESERATVLAGLGCVDYLTIFDEPTAERLVEAVRPELYVKGGDYEGRPPPEATLAARLGAELRLLPLVPGVSTSELVRRIRRQPPDPR
jgi:rfaE bifunctional protein nucleotidyltransferase chain/domain